MASFELNEKYDVACAQINQMEKEERVAFEEEMRARGIKLCPFDGMGCNMALASKSGGVLCCDVEIERGFITKFYCGRIRFRGGQGYDLSIVERFQHGDMFEGVGDKKPDAPCLFDKQVCPSVVRGLAKCGNPISPCIGSMVDKVGFGSLWFCGRIRFVGSKTSVADKVADQHLLDGGKDI